MNRRNFIKLLSYAPGLALLPSLVQANAVFDVEKLPNNVSNLEDDNAVRLLYGTLLSASKFLVDIPKYGIEGGALAYLQEHNSGYRHTSTSLDGVTGDCEGVSLITSTSNEQLTSKAKSCGRKVLDSITNGENGLISLAGSREKGLQHLFESNPDWVMGNSKEIVRLRQIPEFMRYTTKHNIQIYTNDWMSAYKSEIIAGKFDDGTNIRGCTLMYKKGSESYATKNMVSYKGLHLLNKDVYHTVTYYQNLVIWNRNDIVVIEV